MKSAVLASCVGVAAAGSIEIVSSDLSNGPGKVIDNVKGKWTQTLKFLGNDATLSAEYDRNENDSFLNEATLSGTVDDVSYELKTDFGNDVELTVGTTTKDGTALGAVANTGNGITEVSVARPWSIFNQDCDVKATHTPKDGQSKLKLSSMLGHGVKAVGTLTVDKSGSRETDYEVEYASDLGGGRTVAVNANPLSGSGDIEYVDTKTLDATVTASMDFGGQPKLTIKRSWDF